MKTKTFILAALSAWLLASCGSSKNSVAAASGNTQERVMPKQKGDPIEDKVKEYSSDGFKTESMAFTMYEVIYSYRQKLIANSDLVEIISEGVGSSSFAAEMNAQNAASIKYATAAGSVISGGMERDFGNLSANKSWDAFHGAYVQDVANFIMPLIKKEMKFYKKEGGNYVVKVGYTVDEAKAAEARAKAAEKALEDVADGQVFGESVRKYIKERINVNNE